MKKTGTSIYLEIDFLKKLKEQAENNGRSLNGEITFMLKQAIATEQEANSACQELEQ